MRAMLENGLYNAGYPVKLYYLTSCYRYEKPQAGRLRELHQFGVEMFGAAEPVADAQIIALALSAFHRLGLEDVGLQINSIGCPECRKEYHKALKEYFTARKDQLCDTCLSRLERNPMRILDCKSPECQEVCKGAPKITDYLCADCPGALPEGPGLPDRFGGGVRGGPRSGARPGLLQPAPCLSSPPRAWALPWAAAAGTMGWWRRWAASPPPGWALAWVWTGS